MYKIKEEYKNLKTNKKAVTLFVMLFLTGVILIVLSNKASFNTTKEISSSKAEDTDKNTYDYTTEENSIEILLEKTVSNIKGVGKCDIIIKYNSSPEKVIVYDIQNNDRSAIFESSNGNESPFIIKEKTPGIEGVIIVCEGGDNEKVKNTLTETVSDFLGISLHKVKVCEMKGVD